MNEAEGLIAVPETGKGVGVLILHSWWGLNDFFRQLCNRFADEGFVVLAADLYGGKVAKTPEEAKQLRAAVTVKRKEPSYKYLIRMIRVLQKHEAVLRSQIGVVGFSMGGHWAYWLAQRPELGIDATVTFCAARNGDYSNSTSSFFGHYAETDDWVSEASRNRLPRSLEAAGRDFTFHANPGTGHWFFEKDRKEAFKPEASELAWRRTIDFLNRTLKLADIQQTVWRSGNDTPASLRARLIPAVLRSP